MTDFETATALRSKNQLVVVESAAGCGKTYQAASYARNLCEEEGKVLVLTHTHAACDVFRERISELGNQAEICTLDSFISKIATVYHQGLDLPEDVSLWARTNKHGYEKVAAKVCSLLTSAKIITSALNRRYACCICDEYQDCNEHQHGVIMAMLTAGMRVRAFGDPMQRIYKDGKESSVWDSLIARAAIVAGLNEPHRWRSGSKELGEWVIQARQLLKEGKCLDLRHGLPKGLSIITADNIAPAYGRYMLSRADREPVDELVNGSEQLMILTKLNNTVASLRSFFNRRIPIWEGHTRDDLEALAAAVARDAGDGGAVAKAFVDFVSEICVGFTASTDAKALLGEVASGCKKRRAGRPAKIQQIARAIVDSPNHKGVAMALKLLHDNASALAVQIDRRREFHEAVKLGEFDDPLSGLAQLAHRHAVLKRSPRAKCLSTIHKSKGLECNNVLVMPCDANSFGDNQYGRCLLYVALSRARDSLTLVLPNNLRSPLLSYV